MNARGVGNASLVLHVAAGVVLLAVTARTAPAWAVLALGCWWLVLTRRRGRYPPTHAPLAPTVPLIAVAMWPGVMAIGHRLLAWTG